MVKLISMVNFIVHVDGAYINLRRLKDVQCPKISYL